MTDARVGTVRRHMRQGISFFILLSLKVLQLQDVGQTSGPPTDTLSLQPTASSGSATSPFLPAREHWEQRLAPRKPLHLQMQSCAMSSYKQSNLGRVYNYSYCFFLHYPGSKNLTTVLNVHPPPHYLHIMYFLSLHLLFEKTLSEVLSLKKFFFKKLVFIRLKLKIKFCNQERRFFFSSSERTHNYVTL